MVDVARRARPARTGDRVSDTRAHHRRKANGRCEECGQPWPCLPIALVEEIERLERRVQRLQQKRAVPAEADDDRRPKLPPGKRWRRLWTPAQVRRHLAWEARALKVLEWLGLDIMERAQSDAEGGIGSPSFEGGGSGRYEEDGSRTGRVPQMVIAREYEIRDPRTGDVVSSWKVDPVAQDAHEFLVALEVIGDAVEGALERARRLHGLDAEDARRLLDPRAGRCENVNCRKWCDNTMSDRLIIHPELGILECEACWRYRRRNGEARPAHLCRRDLERATGE